MSSPSHESPVESSAPASPRVGDVIWLYQPPNSTAVAVSGQFQELFGRPLPADARVAHRWKVWLHTDDQRRVTLAFEAGLDEGRYDEVYRLMMPDGRIRWVHDRALRLGALGVVRITSDIPILPAAAAPVAPPAAPAPAPVAAAPAAVAPILPTAALPETLDVVLELDTRGAIQQANPAFSAMVGLANTPAGMFLFDLIKAEERAASRKAWDSFTTATRPTQEFLWHMGSAQRWLWVEVRAKRIIGAAGGTRFAVALRDVTRRKQAELTITRHGEDLENRLKERTRELEQARQQVTELEQAQRLVFSALPDIVLRCDREGKILDVAGPSSETLAPRAELLGTRLFDRLEFTAETRALCEQTLERCFESGHLQTCEFAVAGHSARDAEARMTPINAEQALIVLRDVAERNRLREKLRDLVSHDELTGLLSRIALMERFDEQIARAPQRPKALLLINLDQFKQVNDTFGHEIGDTLLKVIANRLTRRAGVDALRARFAGDEFAVGVSFDEGTDLRSSLTQFTQALITEMGNRMRLHGHSVYVTPSIGIAFYPQDGADAETLVRNASVAMSRVKESGRNSFQFYDPAESAALSTRFNTEQGLRRALAEGEIACLFQPKIAVQGGAVVGVEALARWNTGEGSVIVPERFIPLAEKTGLIRQLGTWMLREAMRQISHFPTLGRPAVDLSVNVSVVQLRDQGFQSALREALAEFNFAPNRLTLEIAESAFIDNMQVTADALGEIAHLGVRISIDDFGTGYGGLSWLRNLPVDEIKIDRSFIKGCSIDAFDATIVSGLIEIAHNLGIRSVAVGVERADQLAFLNQVHCDVMQGYLTGAPMTSIELIKSNRIWQNVQTV